MKNKLIPLTPDLRRRLLDAMANGFNVQDFPELGSDFLKFIVNKGIIEKSEDRIQLDESLKKRILKAVAAGEINFEDFPELDHRHKDFLWHLMTTNMIET